MNNSVKLTKEGLAALEQELDHLKTVGRKEVAEKIKVALGYGDLSENSEYDEAKNDQAVMEARIADIEAMLKNAVIIDESEIDTTVVSIGVTVKVRVKDVKTGDTADKVYRIVGSNEANPREGKISDESAVGKALIGAKLGATVEVSVNAGAREYEILGISR